MQKSLLMRMELKKPKTFEELMKLIQEKDFIIAHEEEKTLQALFMEQVICN